MIDRNINLSNSRRPYRISFIIISGFVSLFGAGLAYAFVHEVLKIGEAPSMAVLLLVLILWNSLSIYLTKKYWPFRGDKVKLVKGNKKTIRWYRNLVYAAFIVIASGVLVIALASEGIVPENEALALVLFYGGLFTLPVIFTYYSSKGISANEIITYPFQFLNPNERKIAVEKRVRFLKISFFLVPIMLIVFNFIFNILDWFSVVKISVIVLGGTFYKIKQLRSIV